MAKIPVDKTHPSNRLSPFETGIVSVLMDEVAFKSAFLTAHPIPGDGHFQTVWSCLDGTFVTYRHSWSTGIGYLLKAKSYFDHFKQPLPSWALRMPPIVCLGLCDVAISADQPLPAQCPQAENGEAIFARFAAATVGAKQFKST